MQVKNRAIMTEFKTFSDRQIWKPPFTWFLNLPVPKTAFRPSGNVRSEIVSSGKEGDNLGKIMFCFVLFFKIMFLLVKNFRITSQGVAQTTKYLLLLGESFSSIRAHLKYEGVIIIAVSLVLGKERRAESWDHRTPSLTWLPSFW